MCIQPAPDVHPLILEMPSVPAGDGRETDGIRTYVHARARGRHTRRPAHVPKRPEVLWKAGNTIANGQQTLRVLGVRDDDADQPLALVVEDLPRSATSAAG